MSIAAVRNVNHEDPEARFGFSPITLSVWKNCPLRNALVTDADDLLLNAREQMLDTGEVLYDSSREDSPFFILVVEGLVRVFCVSSQGRQVTARYGSPGQVIGLPFVLAPHLKPDWTDLGIQASSQSRVLHLSAQTFRRVAERDMENMWRLFGELANSLVMVDRSLTRNIFQPIRARVARHMIDLSERRGEHRVVRASQQNIADAVGSVREVISRVVVQFRDEGLIRREDNAYVLLNCAQLAQVAEQD